MSQREEFEKWAKLHGYYTHKLASKEYVSSMTRLVCDAYMAGRYKAQTEEKRLKQQVADMEFMATNGNARIKELEQALKKCSLVLSGEALTKQELINALELSCKALEGKQ